MIVRPYYNRGTKHQDTESLRDLPLSIFGFPEAVEAEGGQAAADDLFDGEAVVDPTGGKRKKEWGESVECPESSGMGPD